MAFAANRHDGTRIYYEVHGHGPPLVLYHGSATSSVVWHELGYVAAFADRRCILIDGRGHGRSDKPRERPAYALGRFVEDVLVVLDELRVRRTSYFGYSLGGRLGYALAAAAPDRLDSLVIGGGSHRPQRGALDRLFYPGFIDTIATDGMPEFLDAWAARLGRAVDPGVRALFLANDPAALVAYLRRTEEEPGFGDAVLARLEPPVLLLAGDHDRERLEDARAAAALLPSAELVTIPGADHFSTPFRRREVVQQVRRFLRDVAR